ncbi:MAG TPA: hypothetical protein VFJ16_28645 [Longimicrobium sp.]|nr:hypothetical protein [Longimicrobium sp.]
MQKLPLDLASLTVATFEPVTAPSRAAVSGDTTDEVCYCFSLLAEDCFGPTAGCSSEPIQTQRQID